MVKSDRTLDRLEARRKVLAIEPWQDQTVLLGMRACLGMGDRTGAARLYKTLEKTLRDELGIEPQVELQELARTLMKQSSQRLDL